MPSSQGIQRGSHPGIDLVLQKRYDTSAEGPRDYFKGLIDKDDGIMVSDVNGWAGYNTDGTPNDLT